MSGPIHESRLIAALREITNDETEAVVIVAVGDGVVSARSFGDAEEALWGLSEAMISIEYACFWPEPEAYAH